MFFKVVGWRGQTQDLLQAGQTLGYIPRLEMCVLIDYQEENYRMLQQTEPTPILGKIIYNQNQAGVSLWSMVMKARIWMD